MSVLAWSRDGDFIVCRFDFWDGAGARIGIISTEDGTIQILKTLSRDFSRYGSTLSLSPDDRYIVYDYLQADDVSTHDVFILATDGSSEERLVSHAADDRRPFWTPDGGRVVFLSDRSGRPGLYAVEVRDGRPAGDPELVRPDVGGMVTLGFNRSGALYYTFQATVEDVYVAELDLNGAGTLSEPRPLTERFEGTNRSPSWSPDGRRIAFLSRRGQDQRVYAVVKSLDTGEEHDFALPFALLNKPDSPGWSADGRHLLIEGLEIGSIRQRDFVSYRLDTETGEVARETFFRDAVGRGPAGHRYATGAQAEGLRAAGVRIFPAGLPFFREFLDGVRPLRPDEDLMWMAGGVGRKLPSGDVQKFGPRGNVGSWALSPDGTQLAWAISTDLSQSLLIMPVTGGAIRELTRLPLRLTFPRKNGHPKRPA